MKRNELKEIIEKLAPEKLQFSWDNSGFNISLHDDIKKIMVAFDLKEQTIDYAVKNGADTIITHHPILFNPLKIVDVDDAIGKTVLKAIKQNLNVYSAHTSFDMAEYGTDYQLMKLIGIEKIEVLMPEKIIEGKVYGIGRVGELEKELCFEEFIDLIKKKLKVDILRMNGIRKNVKKIACIGGSGGTDFMAAKNAGADVLLTGEAKYNNFIDSATVGLALIETGHFDSEKHFVVVMSRHLQNEIDVLQSKVEVYSCLSETAPYDFL